MKRDIRLERIRYLADIRKFVSQELGYLGLERVLDAGCGTGLVSRTIKSQHPRVRVVAVDSDKHAIETARRKIGNRTGIRYELGSLDKLRFPSNEFDVIVAAIVMHHMRQKTRLKVLREFHRTLKGGGGLVILEGKGLARGLASMMKSVGFSEVRKKSFGDIRRIYTGAK